MNVWTSDTFLRIIFFILSFSGLCHADAVPPQVCHLDSCVGVEVVSKEDDMARGLMYRTSLGPDKGMLFVFPDSEIYQFWMKDMHFSLDMIWIDENHKVADVSADISPDTFQTTN